MGYCFTLGRAVNMGDSKRRGRVEFCSAVLWSPTVFDRARKPVADQTCAPCLPGGAASPGSNHRVALAAGEDHPVCDITLELHRRGEGVALTSAAMKNASAISAKTPGGGNW